MVSTILNERGEEGTFYVPYDILVYAVGAKVRAKSTTTTTTLVVLLVVVVVVDEAAAAAATYYNLCCE